MSPSTGVTMPAAKPRMKWVICFSPRWLPTEQASHRVDYAPVHDLVREHRDDPDVERLDLHRIHRADVEPVAPRGARPSSQVRKPWCVTVASFVANTAQPRTSADGDVAILARSERSDGPSISSKPRVGMVTTQPSAYSAVSISVPRRMRNGAPHVEGRR